MNVGVVVDREEDARRLVHWAGLLGRARECAVVVLRRAGGPDGLAAAIASAIERANALLPSLVRGEGAGTHVPEFSCVAVEGSDPPAAFRTELKQREVDLLVLGHPTDSRDREFTQDLFESVSCHSLLLRPGGDEEETAERILVPTSGGPHTSVTLEIAGALAKASGGRVTVLYVQTELGEDAEALGEKVLERAIPKSMDRSLVRTKVVLAEGILAGVAAEAPEYDLILLGTSNQWFIRRILGRTLPEKLLDAPEGPSVAVARRAMPLKSRLERAFGRAVASCVPQLGRPERIAVVERLQASSRWDFDFVFLTCLATLIAGLGLVAGNVAVVIGAMLVAPLMTPLIGAGLALVQGNLRFLRAALRTVVAGFLLALGIGALIGLVLGPEASGEMISRGRPDPIDLAVAFASGMAAAWAIGRPNLSAALPGVAIAASLVPPIATSGIALVTGEHTLAAGASLLFATNLVAIVLGSGLSLFLGGVRAQHLHRRQSVWIRRLVLAAFLLAAAAMIPLSFWLAALAER